MFFGSFGKRGIKRSSGIVDQKIKICIAGGFL
jgi:hypothetical protein